MQLTISWSMPKFIILVGSIGTPLWGMLLQAIFAAYKIYQECADRELDEKWKVMRMSIRSIIFCWFSLSRCSLTIQHSDPTWETWSCQHSHANLKGERLLCLHHPLQLVLTLVTIIRKWVWRESQNNNLKMLRKAHAVKLPVSAMIPLKICQITCPFVTQTQAKFMYAAVSVDSKLSGNERYVLHSCAAQMRKTLEWSITCFEVPWWTVLWACKN